MQTKRIETLCLLLFSLNCSLFHTKASQCMRQFWRHHSRNSRDGASRHAISHRAVGTVLPVALQCQPAGRGVRTIPCVHLHGHCILLPPREFEVTLIHLS